MLNRKYMANSGILTAVLIILVLWITTAYNSAPIQATVGNYQTTNFNISNGKSLEMYKTLKKNNASDESLLKFVTMEDELLNIEKDCVCFGKDARVLGVALSEKIKDAFPGYDFSYHDKHTKQMSEPDKIINKHLSCS